MMTSEDTISPEVALRIALATRVLSEVSVGEMIEALQDCVGDTINEDSLSRVTVASLKTAFGHTNQVDGEEDGEDGTTAEIAAWKEAVAILWGQNIELDEFLPPIEPYEEGDMPDSIRIAVASSNEEQLDGHFGSCFRYLIYQVSAEEIRLVDIRSAGEAYLSDDKNAFRVNLIRDCHILYIVSVGGPAAAKVIQAGIYPMKKTEGGQAREVLGELQTALATTPPPWLAKVMGVAAGDRVRNYKASLNS